MNSTNDEDVIEALKAECRRLSKDREEYRQKMIAAEINVGKLVLKLDQATVDKDSCCAGTELLRVKLEQTNLQIRDHRNIVELAVDDLTVAVELGVTSNRVESTIRILKEALALKRVDGQQNFDTCENYRDDSGKVRPRFCETYAASKYPAHSPTCQFFRK